MQIMMHSVKRFLILAAAVMAAICADIAMSADVYDQFNSEEIKPYIKIMRGPWVSNIVAGGPGHYRITAKMPRGSQYVLGLFDNKIKRTGKDERSAVILVNGVNPLVKSESVPLNQLETADVSGLRKAAFDGLTFNARDTFGKDCTLKVIDTKEEYEFGEVRPFTAPNRPGVLGRIDIILYAAPANPPTPGATVNYGKPINRYTITLMEE